MSLAKKRGKGRALGPTLAWQIVSWCETFLCHGPGDLRGGPLEIDHEFMAFLARAYELAPRTGARLVDEAMLSRCKGRAKSEVAGMIVCVELIGPARFDHWATAGEVSWWGHRFEAGEPVGRPVKDPFIRCLATEESQAGNTYDNVQVMLEHLKEHHGRHFPKLDIGLTRTFVDGGGEVRPSTASSAAKDGGKETFAVADEALDLDTPLPTPTGWTTMGRVRPGDDLVGSDGRPVGVVKVTEAVERDCFRVVFEDGTWVVASGGHLWASKVASSAALPRVRTTSQMLDDGRRFRVPAPAPAKMPETPGDIHPYLLGLWLGDGDARNATISAGSADIDAIEGLIRRTGYTTKRCHVRPDQTPLLYVSKVGSHRNRYSPVRGFKVQLKEGGLLGNKHIPPSYLRGSIDQRTALLQGLMDSDGHVGDRGSCCFSNANERLVKDVLELLRSLGQVAKASWRADSRARTGGCFKVHFAPRHGLQPFLLPRKAERVRPHRRGPEWVTIAKIEPVGTRLVRCVAVDAPDSLFAAGPGWHLTHNTHLYLLPELHDMYDTVSRNLTKRPAAEPWILNTSTMYQPGRDSEAERLHTRAREGADGRLLFDHLEAKMPADWDDDDQLVAALREAAGAGAEWMDFTRRLRECRRTSKSKGIRYFLNRAVVDEEQAVAPARWAELSSPGRPPAGCGVALGFDGSESGDSTGIVGCEIATGRLFMVGVWERPEGVAEWRVDRLAVRAALDDAFRTWKVARLYCDPKGWRSEIADWQATWTDDVVVEYATNSWSRFAKAVDRFLTGVATGNLTHDGDAALARHVGNARLVEVNPRRPEAGQIMVKDSPNSANKIDLAVAATLATAARDDALAAGWVPPTEHEPLIAWR